jgi:hypothetical protein
MAAGSAPNSTCGPHTLTNHSGANPRRLKSNHVYPPGILSAPAGLCEQIAAIDLPLCSHLHGWAYLGPVRSYDFGLGGIFRRLLEMTIKP